MKTTALVFSMDALAVVTADDRSVEPMLSCESLSFSTGRDDFDLKLPMGKFEAGAIPPPRPTALRVREGELSPKAKEPERNDKSDADG